MTKKHILIGIAILAIFIGILLLQLGGDGIKKDIGYSIQNGLAKLLARDKKIEVSELSYQLEKSHCHIQKDNNRTILVVAPQNSCSVYFPPEKGTIVRTVPTLKHTSGICNVTLRHVRPSNKERYLLPDSEHKSLTLKVLEQGATLNIIATGNAPCAFTIDH
ncbi:MAG: Unknown protein [uncultured Thiotrichaceae bacterium]|uniref:Uncharacterized protein n=1 Tax=uncultured Thiotrichaceae bacterium TaxID=298394 RepID=A0A6S6SUV0_9GAMM|nr:MAG: Unknown protein [uncultured Thiotrichaceae bacterium]